jgi:proteasome assembly chaperone (PAC2) family protein
MDLLTKALLEDLLDTQKTVAIYGGGFKPPTKGHFSVAKLTLEQFPEIDELKIFVGGGVRDGITQDESIQIWDIYKNYLSPKVDVEASVAPVKSVLDYAKENPDTKVYWILGARDGDEGDLADIKNRTKSLDKYPNLEVKVITTSGGVSGTKTRQAIIGGVSSSKCRR